MQCEKSVYPFHDGAIEDFRPIFQKLIDVGYHDLAMCPLLAQG